MKRADYEAKIMRPLLYIRILTVCLIIFNLFLPIFQGDLGYKVIGQWLICILCLYTMIGAQGGLGTLFFIKDAIVPLNMWVAVRFLEFLVVWLRFGFKAFEPYFWFLLVLDALFILVVAIDHSKYRYVEEGDEQVA